MKMVSEIKRVENEAASQGTNKTKLRNHHCHMRVLLNKVSSEWSHTRVSPTD